MNKKIKEKFKDLISFWRLNPQRFIVDYLGVKLKFFQEVLVYQINHADETVWVAARGLSKSFTVAIFAVAMAILYPGYKVVITSGTKGQAGKVISEKIDGELVRDYPLIKQEIVLPIKTGSEPSVTFKNGSKILSATPNDNARGLRGTLIVSDESRLIPPKVAEEIFDEMMQARKFKLVDDAEDGELEGYYDAKPKVVHMSSAWYKNNHLWLKYKNLYERMNKGEQVFAMSNPYHLGIKEKIIPPSKIIKRKRSSNYDPVTFSIESEGLFFGEAEDAFFKLDMFNKHTSNLKIFEVYFNLNQYGDKCNGNWKDFLKYHKSEHPKGKGQINLMSFDVAPMSGGDGNDASILQFFKLIPTDNGYYERKLVNIIPFSNFTEEEISVFVKRWFYLFQCDIFVLDIHGSSASVFSHLVTPTYDDEFGVEYKAWKIYDSNLKDAKLEEYRNKTIYDDCEEVIYGISAGSNGSEFNHEIAMGLRNSLKNSKGFFKILPHFTEGRDIIAKKYSRKGLDPEMAELKLMPYYNTDAMKNECVLLEAEWKNGKVKLEKVGRNRKDRYTTLAYADYVIRQLDEELVVDGDTNYQFKFRS